MTVILWTKKWAEETKNFKFFETIESSNKKAKKLKNISKDLLLLIAREQTNPYGRRGRKWQASDFMATWTWKSNTLPFSVFSPLLGLALYHSFQEVWPSHLWSLKAPNDIYLAHKKTAGLLLETQVHKNDVQVILGLGINVLKAPSHTECINNHHTVNECLWIHFLNYFWQSLSTLKNKNISKIPLNALLSLKQALRNHPQYKDLEKVLEDGSLVFKTKTLHWSDL